MCIRITKVLVKVQTEEQRMVWKYCLHRRSSSTANCLSNYNMTMDMKSLISPPVQVIFAGFLNVTKSPSV